MILSQHVPQFELLDPGNIGPSGYTARFAAPDKGCDSHKNLINHTLIEERPVQRGSTLTQHSLSTKTTHFVKCVGQIDGVDSALNHICHVSHSFQFARISIGRSRNDGALRRSTKHRQREVELKLRAHHGYTSDRPRSIGETPCLRADAGRGRVVMFGHCCGAADQNDVRQGSYRAEDVFVARAAKRTGNTLDFGDPVNGRNHVDHQPRPAGHKRPLVTINVVQVDFKNRRREQPVHSLMLTRTSVLGGHICRNRPKERRHHNQWFSTGPHLISGLVMADRSTNQRQTSDGRDMGTFAFSQFTGLRDSRTAASTILREPGSPMLPDHAECRSAAMCRTTQRNPQLTHRSILLSPYRSTSESSYICGCGGLGDQLADGVRWSNGKLLPGFLFASTMWFRASRSGRSGTTPTRLVSSPPQTSNQLFSAFGENDDDHF